MKLFFILTVGLSLLFCRADGSNIFSRNMVGGSILDDIGIKQSLTQEGLNQCVELVAPIVVSAFNSFSVPDVELEVSNYFFKLYDIVASDFDLSGIFASLVDNVGISGGCEHAALNVDMSFSFYQNGWPYSSGNGQISVVVSSLDLSAVVSFYLDDQYKEHIKVETVSVVLKDMDIHINIDGSSGSLINTVIQLLNPIITDLVETSFENIVAQAVESVISEGMESPSYYELENGVAIDIREYHAPMVSDVSLTGSIVGAYSPTTELPDYYEDFDPEEMPSSKGSSGIQLFVSYETVESMWRTYMEVGYFDNIEETINTSEMANDVEYIVASGKLDNFNNFKPMYTGFYVEIEGSFTLSLYNKDDILKEVYDVNFNYGIAQQPNLPISEVTNTQIVGMKHFYHSLNNWVMSGNKNEEDDLMYSTMLWVYCLQPFLDHWGQNNGYPVVVFNTMYLSNPESQFGDGYFYIGGDLTPP